MSSILLDSSCWIEILSEGKRYKICEAEIKHASEIIVPTLVIYEVYRKIRTSLSEPTALKAIVILSKNSVHELSRDVALLAADISIEYQLPMADSIILAHSDSANAQLITLDKDFLNVPRVKVLQD